MRATVGPEGALHRSDRRRAAVWTLVLVAAVGVSGDRVGACRCPSVPVCWAAEDSPLGRSADVVFVGRVIQSTYPVTRFRVERLAAGDAAPELTLIGSRWNCDLGFANGERYLVYAYRNPETGDLGASMCSRTVPMSDPRAGADLAYFDARRAGRPTGGWLSGVVEERHYDSARGPEGRVRQWVVRPLARIPITVTSPTGESHSTLTDTNGRYVFTGLPRMNWRVVAELPAPFKPHDGLVSSRYIGPGPTVPWLKDASCAEADVDARVDGVVKGQLLDNDGRPARGIAVELANVAALDSDPDALRDAEVVSDQEGRFEFRPVPAGRYVVGVNLSRPHMTNMLDRRRYHPGVRQRSAATVIRLDRGERIQLEPFRLPP
jgi:hypothetical protein